MFLLCIRQDINIPPFGLPSVPNGTGTNHYFHSFTSWFECTDWCALLVP